MDNLEYDCNHTIRPWHATGDRAVSGWYKNPGKNDLKALLFHAHL